MIIRKANDNIAQVVTMNFNRNGTSKFNLDIKNNGFILPRQDKNLRYLQSLFAGKV